MRLLDMEELVILPGLRDERDMRKPTVCFCTTIELFLSDINLQLYVYGLLLHRNSLIHPSLIV